MSAVPIAQAARGPFQEWLDARVVAEPHAAISDAALYEDFTAWARHAGFTPMATFTFGKMLTEHGLKRDRVYLGHDNGYVTRRLGWRLAAPQARRRGSVQRSPRPATARPCANCQSWGARCLVAVAALLFGCAALLWLLPATG